MARRALFAADTNPTGQTFRFGIATDGALSSLGAPVFVAQIPSALAVSSDAKSLYAALPTGVRRYSVSAAGDLADPVTVAAGTDPAAIALSPVARRLYVANRGSNSITRFAIADDGSLSGAATTPNGDATAPDALAFTPDGRFLYVANATPGTISVYSVDALDGSLTTAGTSVAAGSASSAPASLAVSPSGANLYAALPGDSKVAGWSIDATSGALTALDASPYSAGAGARGIAIAPDGKRLLAANPGDGTISRFAVVAGGVLAARQDAAPTLTGAQSVAISPDGHHAYVGGSSSVGAYDLSAAADLQAHGSALTTNGNHGSLAITPDLGPEARLDPSPAAAGSVSNFQGGGSTDEDGTVAQWHWDFGDGTTADGAGVSHTYANAGPYTVRLTVTDDEGCSTASSYTGQSFACAGNQYATTTRVLDIPPPTSVTTPEPSCQHDGEDGFCGTPDHKAPLTTVLGFTNGASIAAIDAPEEIVGSIGNDPSGIQQVELRFSKAAGTIFKKKTTYKRTCRRVHGKKRCKRRKIVKKTNTKVPACLTVSGKKSYLVKYVCSKVPWVTIPGDSIFRYTLPVVLGIGSYSVEAIAMDGAGNKDVLEAGRNRMTFKIVKTPTNVDTTGGGTTTTPTTTTPTVDDTGSPFGKG
jgi:6-phosphogluconolactonase (cycloisomerase 2 family)